jgi:hypothetical protein
MVGVLFYTYTPIGIIVCSELLFVNRKLNFFFVVDALLSRLFGGWYAADIGWLYVNLFV